MNLFISPHDDDNVLFGAFTCIRETPLVLIITDSYRQPKRGEKGCDAKTREEESRQANAILGCPIVRLGIPDDNLIGADLFKILPLFQNFEKVYVPAIYELGNPDHNLVGQVATQVFREKVVYYSTYTRKELWMKGNREIVPTPQENNLKLMALLKYQSQLNLAATRPHFDAVMGKSEWLL